MTPTKLLGIPSVLSLAFFGGLWGILSYLLMKFINKNHAKFFLSQILFGGIFPTLVALFVVFPLKGIAVAPAMYLIGFFVNAAWGLGMAVGLKMMIKSSS